MEPVLNTALVTKNQGLDSLETSCNTKYSYNKQQTVIKLFLKIFFYSQRSVSCSAIINETPSWNRCERYRDYQPEIMQRVRSWTVIALLLYCKDFINQVAYLSKKISLKHIISLLSFAFYATKAWTNNFHTIYPFCLHMFSVRNWAVFQR